MSETKLYIGNTPVVSNHGKGTGEFLKIHGETFFKISGSDSMPPFFMTVVSCTDQWMFIASNGSLTAGRKNPESALFPYYTDDKIIDTPEITGSKTILRVAKGGKTYLWEPFSERYQGAYQTESNLYKNKLGNKLIFEEINHSLKLGFQYMWTFSDKYGFVKTSVLENKDTEQASVEVLDGLQNLLPYGIDGNLQNARSTLVDAYKKNELDRDSGMGIFSLSSMIVDKAEPSEALKATTVWSQGLENTRVLLSSKQLNGFRQGAAVEEETFTKACKAAYFVNTTLQLTAEEEKMWLTVAEVNQDTAQVIDLRNKLSASSLTELVEDDIETGTRKLRQLVGLADGLQMSEDRLVSGRHYSNVLFNIMRGGVFEDEYAIFKIDFESHAKQTNHSLGSEMTQFLELLPEVFSYTQLLDFADKTRNATIQRICTEFLPLSFSRRHGDPSRPWNYFNIDLVDDSGRKKISYEGNWRDIFQNWEALAYSFPAFIKGMIARFVNASTIDGYNPYRITNEGIDWEVIEPDDPWSYIGYWGDHQIIYLQKLMEHAEAHYPGMLGQMLVEKSFVYANVPYRIKDYHDIKENLHDTIDFDHDVAEQVQSRVKNIGADGKLVFRNGEVLTVNFAEKILVMLLTKLYNFVPNGGIWLNTQRPEWNDANNALVGNGLSMVTLNYLSRTLRFCHEIFLSQNGAKLELNCAVAELFHTIHTTFMCAPKTFDKASRESFIDALGNAGEVYRQNAYTSFQSGVCEVEVSVIIDLLEISQSFLDRTLVDSKREDGLYHAYNLLTFDEEGAEISYLYEMLEGQVAALSSGLLKASEVLDVLNALKSSEMYRQDQYSYMLYPNRVLKTFLEKNTIPEEFVSKSKLLQQLQNVENNGLVVKDASGNLHFDGALHNANNLKEALNTQYENSTLKKDVEEENLILQAFETVFNHVAFTGRSGTFYGYEGLGSIYWHMVSKLLLAVQESIHLAEDRGESSEVLGKLMDHYYEIRAGIGINKDPKLYGAFPTDAYSHTPFDAGAQQPGLTGQVKEDVLNRWAELGIRVQRGRIVVDPVILSKDEFLKEPQTLKLAADNGEIQRVEVNKNELVFTYCGVLFMYRLSQHNSIEIAYQDGHRKHVKILEFPDDVSREIFSRSKAIKQVTVELNLS